MERFEILGMAWSDLSVIRMVSIVSLPIIMPYSCKNSIP